MDSSFKSFGLRACIIILITLVVYIPAIRAGFIWDDDLFLTQNRLIHADDGLYRFWFTTEPPDYFPLVSTLLWLEWRLWGMNATGYHVVNILFHALSSVVIWLVLRRLKIPGAWLAALIFAIHPVNVESVAWITERKNTQPMVFYLLAIWVYLKFESDGYRRWYLLALFLFLLALLSKTSVVMLPFVLLGCAWWQRGGITRKDLLHSIPFFILSGLLGLVTVWFQYNVAIGGEIVRTDGFFSRLAGAGWAVWFYIHKAIVPYKLSFVYPRWEIDATAIVSYLPIIVLLGCFAAFWRYRKGWGRPFLFGFGYYVLTLFPTLGFFNIYFMKYSLVADHWQYTSLIGIIALAVGIGDYILSRWYSAPRKWLAMAAVALVGMLCILSWKQESIYANNEMLWRDTISKNPNASIAQVNLGVLLRRQGRLEEAIAHFSKALQANPQHEGAHNNLGLALYEIGRLDEAISHYDRAIEIKPNYAVAHHNLGLAYVRQGKPGKAIDHFSRALQAKPDYPEAYDQLGMALWDQGKVNEAITSLSKALQIKPDYAEGHSNLAIVLAKTGDSEAAMHHFSQALQIQADFAEAHYNLGLLLYEEGSLQDAIRHFSRALRIKPEYVDAHHNLALALAKKGQIDEAISHFSEALKIKPDSAKVHLDLGLVLAEQGKIESAFKHFREAVKIEPELADGHYNLGLALAMQGRQDEAIVHLSKALEIKPDSAETHLNLGALLAGQARFDDAISHFSEALRIKPDFVEAEHYLRQALTDPRRKNKTSSVPTGH